MIINGQKLELKELKLWILSKKKVLKSNLSPWN